MMYIVMIIKAKNFSGYYDFLHVVSRGNDSVVVISPDRKRCRTPVVSRGNDSVVVISPDRKRCRTPVVELVVKLII